MSVISEDIMTQEEIDEYNEKITEKKFYKLDDAINCNILSRTAFIIANERFTNNKTIGRYYTVFPSFRNFLQNRQYYPHCHELFVDHANNKANLGGRLVFDFDIKNIVVPDKFKQIVENFIEKVISEYFHHVDSKLFVYVWSTSVNKNKFSKHLTVKNFYFNDWMKMSKIFYNLFQNMWDKSTDPDHTWISGRDLIDMQIVRNRASLRMAYSSKLDGTPLILDNKSHHFIDSLIRIYFKNDRLAEQTVTFQNLRDDIIDEQNKIEEENEYYTHKYYISASTVKRDSKPVFDNKIYETAYNILNEFLKSNNKKTVFKKGRISGSVLGLLRSNPDRCILSGKCHEAENAFLVITRNTDPKKFFCGIEYHIRFGCFRYCSKHKTKIVGYIDKYGAEIISTEQIEKKYSEDETANIYFTDEYTDDDKCTKKSDDITEYDNLYPKKPNNIVEMNNGKKECKDLLNSKGSRTSTIKLNNEDFDNSKQILSARGKNKYDTEQLTHSDEINCRSIYSKKGLKYNNEY